VDARKGEVFSATYRHAPGGVQRLTAPRLCSPEDLASELAASGEDCLLVGDGAVRYAGLFADGRFEVAGAGLAHPTAAALVELAHPKALREEFVQPSEIEPLYLRRSDAEINWDRDRDRDGERA
jgi:tRNA threonylcarbamoyladenosine biosynthesis protein TsaB